MDEADHLLVRRASRDLLAHDQAQAAGEGGVAVLDGLVLADQAAQLLADLARAGLERGVGEAVGRVADLRACGWCGGEQREGEEERADQADNRRRRGCTSLDMISGVIGPAQRQRTTPCRSMM